MRKAAANESDVQLRAVIDTAVDGVIIIDAGGHLFCVADNGIGIAEEYRTQIFEIFQRSTPRRRTRVPGSGWQSSRKVLIYTVARYGSNRGVGEGSTFFLRFPHAPRNWEH